ncbi:MAG TPA: hypothetical protein VGF40_10565, partial [Thermoanaerobaculia bacterium]
MVMRPPPGSSARRLDYLASGWAAEEIALLRHASLPWGARPQRSGEVDGEPLVSAASWGERDRLAILAQLAAHLAFLREAGIPAGRFAADEWSASRRRGDDARLIRTTIRARDDESAASFLGGAAELLRLPRLASLHASWVKPDTVYAEIEARLRSGPRSRRWLRAAATGNLLPPGINAARAILGRRPVRVAGDADAMIEALRALAALARDPVTMFEIGGPAATPLVPYSAMGALADTSFRVGEEAAAFERIDIAIPRDGALVVVTATERLDDSSVRVLRFLASGRPDVGWAIAGEIPVSLQRAIEPDPAATRHFLLSPSLNARREIERALDPLPQRERSAWLVSFCESDAFGAFLDAGILAAPPAAFGIEEPKRSYLAALAVAGQRLSAAAAGSILRELGWLRPLTELAFPAVATIDDAGIEFRSASCRNALAETLPVEARPGLCALAASALEREDPWHAALLRLEAGDPVAVAAIRDAGPFDDRMRDELLAAIARLRAAVRERPEVVELHAEALLEAGRYRLARQEASRLRSEAGRLLAARTDRRLGLYAQAGAALAPIVAKKRAGARALVAAAELARLADDSSAAAALLARAAAEATAAEMPSVAYERALLAVEGGGEIDPRDIEALASAPYLGARLATYLALRRDDIAAARREAERAIAIARSPLERIDASLDLFFAHFVQGDWDAARLRGRECLAIVEETDGDRAAGGILFTLGYLLADRGEWERAEDALARLRSFYEHASDLRRLRETSLLAAHLAFARGRYAEARAHVAEMELGRLSADEREAALLIVDEVDWIEGIDAPIRSIGASACRELRDRHALLRARRGEIEPEAIANPFLRSVASWERQARRGGDAGPPPASSPSESLLLLRALRGARRRGIPVGELPDRIARELGVDPEPAPRQGGHDG